LFVIGARLLPPKIAVGAEFSNRSIDLASIRAVINGQDSKPIEITQDQWQFLRGVYAMNPEAPPGLPYGDDAVLVQGGGDSSGLLLFVDSDKSSAPMHAPPSLLSLIDQVTMADNGSKGYWSNAPRRYRAASRTDRAWALRGRDHLPAFTAAVSLSSDGRSQAVSIQPRGGDISDVRIELRRNG
jgi:hypothetical protein